MSRQKKPIVIPEEPVEFKNGLATVRLLKDNKSILVSLKGKITRVPESKEFNYGTAYSFGARFNERDLGVFDDSLNVLVKALPEFVETSHDYKPKFFHKQGNAFIKLKPNDDGESFKPRINVSLTPEDLTCGGLIRKGMDVQVKGTLIGWINQNSYGVSLVTDEIHFGTITPAAPVKRSKTRDVLIEDEAEEDNGDESSEEVILKKKF